MLWLLLNVCFICYVAKHVPCVALRQNMFCFCGMETGHHRIRREERRCILPYYLNHWVNDWLTDWLNLASRQSKALYINCGSLPTSLTRPVCFLFSSACFCFLCSRSALYLKCWRHDYYWVANNCAHIQTYSYTLPYTKSPCTRNKTQFIRSCEHIQIVTKPKRCGSSRRHTEHAAVVCVYGVCCFCKSITEIEFCTLTHTQPHVSFVSVLG